MPACSLAVAGAAVCFALVFAPKRMQVGVTGLNPSVYIYVCLYTHEKDYPLWDDHPNIWNLDH